MAVLAGQARGRRLGLSTAADSASKKVVFVKLTDASLEALHAYLQNQKRHHASTTTIPTAQSSLGNKPTIQFSQNTGTICIPIGDDGNQAKFSFSLSSIDEKQNGPQGSFECLESKRPGSLESLGSIQDKLHVQASEDAYTRFGERMSDVKKENEKRTTVFIEDRSMAGGGLVSSKIVRKPSSHHPYPKSFDAAARYGNASAGLLPGSHPMLDRSQNKLCKRAQNPEIMKRPLRERIVHLLAVRPYKKPELLLRINKDGLYEKDKKNVLPLVKQVSFMKDNTYHLMRHIWNDVSEDWPFYTEEERQSFRRRKPQNLTPPGSDGSTGSGSSLSSGHSSSSSHPASPQPPSLKRPNGNSNANSSYFDAMGEPTSKKKRVSNYVRPAAVGGQSPMLGRSPGGTSHNSSSGRSPLNDAVMMDTNNSSEKTTPWLALNSGLSPREPSRATNKEDFTISFTTITNPEQRKRYKAEFNRDYNRYMSLHSSLEKVSRRFTQLENQLKQEHETSPAHKRLKSKIVQEYAMNKKDSKYVKAREEFQYLHEKLAHIKKLVHAYDTVKIEHS